MGRLIYSMSVSLDGFVETPSRSLDWVIVDEELHALFNDEARAMSTFLYGRRMCELMSGYWPTAERDPSATPAMVEFGQIWTDKPKVVFSTTLDRVGWNSRLVREGAAGWKERPVGDIRNGADSHPPIRLPRATLSTILPLLHQDPQTEGLSDCISPRRRDRNRSRGTAERPRLRRVSCLRWLVVPPPPVRALRPRRLLRLLAVPTREPPRRRPAPPDRPELRARRGMVLELRDRGIPRRSCPGSAA
jgi:hypothetical protein